MSSATVAYWKRTLEGAPALTEAPTDRQRPATVCPGHCALVKQHFPLRLLASIAQNAPERGVDTFLAAVWQARAYSLPRSLERNTHVSVNQCAPSSVHAGEHFLTKSLTHNNAAWHLLGMPGNVSRNSVFAA